jgi:hypothetical protein
LPGVGKIVKRATGWFIGIALVFHKPGHIFASERERINDETEKFTALVRCFT